MNLFNRINGGRAGGNASNPQNKPVCPFYLEGRCKFGDSCRNYHPPREQSSQSSQSRNQQLTYHLSAETIKADLTTGDEKPIWPLSCYGPGREAPRQLLEGALEQSPEELRVQYYLAKTSGSTQQYEQNERDALDRANQQGQRILNDIDGAIKYVIDAKDQHPNRDDMTKKAPGDFNWKQKPSSGPSTVQTGGSAFGQPSTFGQASTGGAAQGSTFGQPSAFGRSAFGGNQKATGSAFGQPSVPGSQTSAFGQPSSAGPQTSTFGAPSNVGSGGSAFGRASALRSGAGSAFGQTSALGGSSPFGGGQASSNTQGSTFGQASAPGTGSTFGKPSTFGAAAPGGSPFGQSNAFGSGAAQTSTGGSAFGQPSAPGQQQSAFGQSSGSGQQQSTFGQTSAPGSQPSAFAKPSPFASAGTGTSAFGQPSQPGGQSAFGSASAFGTSTNGPSFGRPSSSGQQQSNSGAGQSSNPFAANQSGAATGASAATAPRPPGQPLTSWKGRPVMNEDRMYFYQNAAGRKERIWHPDGPPGPNPDTEASPANIYDSEALATVLKQVYDYVRENGTFKDGLVPEVPPKRDWIAWDL